MIESLVTALVANFLVPYAKDLLQSMAEKVSEEAGTAAGEEAVSVTRKVWARVKSLFGDHPGDEGVLGNFEQDPDDEITRAYFEKRLREFLEQDPGAAHELAELVNAPAPGANASVSEVIHNSGVLVQVRDSQLTNSKVV